MSTAAPSYAEVAAGPPIPEETPSSSTEHAAETVRPQSSSSRSDHSRSSNEVVVVGDNDGHDHDFDEGDSFEMETSTVNHIAGTVTAAASSAQAKLSALGSNVSAAVQRSTERVADTVKQDAESVLARGKAGEMVPSFLEKTDEIVDRLSKLLSNSTGQDRALMTLSYGLTALTSHMDYLSHYRALAHARDSQKVIAVPVGLSSYLVFARPPSRSKLVGLSTRLKALVALIGDYRIFVRLWGMLGMWQWLRATLKSPPSDITVRNITYAQVAVNVVYQILENVAYLGGKKIVPVSTNRQNKYWLWSSRCWMAHVILEFWRLKRVRDLAAQQQSTESKTGVSLNIFDVSRILKGRDEQSAWLRSLWVNAAYAPLTVHWSLENGALSQLSVGTLGAIAGAIGLSQQWRNTA